MSQRKFCAALARHKKYVIPACIIVLCAMLQILSRHNEALANALTFGFSGYMRALLALITSWLPFSLGETVIVMLPVLVLFTFVISFTRRELGDRILHTLVVILTVMYTLFVLSFAPAYGTSSADKLFELTDAPVDADELYSAAIILTNEINELCDDIDYDYASFSRMGYDLDVLGDKLISAYDSLADEYDFLFNFRSRLKPIALSNIMTYTHISGVYTYYTGETNINTNFPDYTLPYTCAHEMAHQRGFAREKEANLVAFLVCESSSDAYVAYSGKLSMLEYIMNALYTADRELYADVFYSLDIRVRCEMAAYSEFFDKYRDSTASEVAGAINDTYLKSNGQSEGERSYGLVVDLAVAYILDNNDIVK